MQFLCPVCSAPLECNGKTYMCGNHHCFDTAKAGYVNLLLNSSAGRHGDDKLMVKARASLLNKGYYEPLSRKIASMLSDCFPEKGVLLDAGCGEGYYTANVLDALNSLNKELLVIGIDISKEALVYAGKRNKAFRLAVASSAALPVADGSVDAVMNVFSPLIENEFLRVLRPGGYLLRVIPLEQHLFELKALIYDTPYENTVPDTALPGFELSRAEDICYRAVFDNNEDIMNLFRMTPYYYKTSRKDQQKAEAAETLATQLCFRALLYEKL